MTPRLQGKARLRYEHYAQANGVAAFETAPSGVLIGPGPPPAPPPPQPAPPAAQRNWRPLGPFAIPHGQTTGTRTDPRPPVAGRVSAIAVDPADATHILAGAAGGGVWESRDRGVTWDPRTDTLPSLATGAIAFDPTNPGTVYAGTGEGDALWDLGAGLLRSTDGGRNWVVHHAASFSRHGFYDLAVDPLNGQHLLAGCTNGLWESTDGGANWFRRHAELTWSISFHPAVPGNPASTQEVFAACPNGLQRSGDGGANWAPFAFPGAPAVVPGFSRWARLAVAHAPSAPDVVYAWGAGRNPAPPPTYDAGHLAVRTTAAGALAAIAPPPAVNTQQSFYDWLFAVAPDTADRLYLGGVDLWRGDRNPVAGTWTWTLLSPRPTGDAIHPDQHAIAFDPGAPQTVYIGNDGGVWRTPDAGTRWEALNRGLCIVEFEYVAQHPQVDAWLLGGTQDNGSQRFEGTGTWYHVADGDGGDCAVDDDAPATCYHTYFSASGVQPIHVERSRVAGGWATWRFLPTSPLTHPTLFYPPLEGRGRTIAQGGQDVFISEREAAPGSFTRVTLPPMPAPPPPAAAPAGPDLVSALEVPTPDRVLVATMRGRILSIARNPAPPPAWSPPVVLFTAPPPIPTPPGQVPAFPYTTDLLTAPDDPRRIWATFAGPPASLVYRSDDGGANWNPAQGDLPAGLRIWAIAADPANPPTVFVGTDRGVFRSTDLGATWTAVGAGLPNCQVKDLLFQPAARVLRAATKSRGVWELDVDLAPAATAEVFVRYHAVDSGRALPAGTAAPVETPDPFSPGSAARWWESPDVKVDAAPHLRPVLADVEFDVFADDHGLAAAGLFDEAPVPGQTARVYVQVHSRSHAPATDVDVRVFFAAPGIGFPALPANFWTGFPANAPASASSWQPIAAAQRIARIEPGRARLAAFEWAVPADVGDGAALLAAAGPAGTAFAPAGTVLSQVLASTGALGLHNQVPLRPAPGRPGPRPGAVPALVHASTGAGAYALEVDAGSAPIVVGAVLSTALSNLAGPAGSRPLNEADFPALGELLARRPGLGGQLDRSRLYPPPPRGPWLRNLTLAEGDAEPIVLLVARPQPPRGRWCVVQRDSGGTVRGGLTLTA